MFDVGLAEIIVIFVIALLVLGPERLPEVARTVGRWIGRARQMARSMQYELERELDLNNIAGDSTAATAAARENAQESPTQKPPESVSEAEPDADGQSGQKTLENDSAEAADDAPSEPGSVTPHPTYGRLPERTGADYDDDPDDNYDDLHAGERDDRVDKAGG